MLILKLPSFKAKFDLELQDSRLQLKLIRYFTIGTRKLVYKYMNTIYFVITYALYIANTQTPKQMFADCTNIWFVTRTECDI